MKLQINSSLPKWKLQPRTKPFETNRENACFFLSSRKNWNLRQMNAWFPPSPYPKLFRIAWQLYTLVFRPRQLWIEGGEGVYFFCLEDTGVGRKSWKIDGIVSTVLSGVVASFQIGAISKMLYFQHTAHWQHTLSPTKHLINGSFSCLFFVIKVTRTLWLAQHSAMILSLLPLETWVVWS